MIESSSSRFFLLFSIIGFLSVEATPHSLRIVKGQEIKDEIIPFIVSLQRDGNHICGGSIINERTILLAAHCVDGTPLDSLTIHVGDTTLTLKKGKIIGVEDVHCHPNFDWYKLDNDIGILRLNESLQYNQRVKPIALIDDNMVLNDDSYATVYGWGNTAAGGPQSEVLKFARMSLVSRKKCQRSQETKLTNHHLCAGAKGADVCNSDSGGPLVQNGRLIGIVSFGPQTCSGIGVYANVQYYLPWLKVTLLKEYGEQV